MKKRFINRNAFKYQNHFYTHACNFRTTTEIKMEKKSKNMTTEMSRCREILISVTTTMYYSRIPR